MKNLKMISSLSIMTLVTVCFNANANAHWRHGHAHVTVYESAESYERYEHFESTTRYSEYEHRNCLVELDPVLMSSNQTKEKCQLTTPLALVEGPHSYPRLGLLNPRYWQGAYSNIIHSVNTYRYTLYDQCSHRVVQTSYRTVSEEMPQIFAVDNPNLSDSVQTSFEAVTPMTDQEALQALRVARMNCATAP